MKTSYILFGTICFLQLGALLMLAQSEAPISNESVRRLAGDLDPVYRPEVEYVLCAAALPGGKVLVGGRRVSAHAAMAKLDEKGAIDPSFQSSLVERIEGFLMLADGGLLVWGSPLEFKDGSQSFVAKLRSDGSQDTTFQPILDANLRGVLQQPDGKLIIWGDFNLVCRDRRPLIARLNPDGTLDSTFDAKMGAYSENSALVWCAAIQSDGKIVCSGRFDSVRGVNQPGFVRLLPDGAPDPSFRLPEPDQSAGYCRQICLQPDGKMVLCWSAFEIAGKRRAVVRLNTDGSLDNGFSTTLDGVEYTVAIQRDGKYLISGVQTIDGLRIGGGIGRLNSDGTHDPDFVFNPSKPGIRHFLTFLPQDSILVAHGSLIIERVFLGSQSPPPN